MNKDLSEIQEYLKTVGWTILVAAIIVSIIIIDLRINASKPKQEIEKTERIDITNARMGLVELYHEEEIQPDDYVVNLKLAFLHEILKEYDKAEVNYEKALVKSENAPFAIYKAAMFYAKQKKYESAISLSMQFPDIKDKKVYEMKARFYDELADSFLSDKDYTNAIKTYKIAYKFARNSEDTIKYKTAQKLAEAYNKYADKFIEENDPIHASIMLNNAIEYYPDAYAKYKLGIIYQNVDKIKSQKYIEEAYEANPKIVNLELYNKLLNDIISEYEKSGEYSKAGFYRLKLENFKRKLAGSNIYKDDMEIKNINIQKVTNNIFIKKKYHLLFELTNNTKYPIDNLFIKIIIQPRGEKNIEIEEKIVSRNNPIPAKRTTKVTIPLEISKNDIQKHCGIKFLAKKSALSEWTMIDYLTLRFTK